MTSSLQEGLVLIIMVSTSIKRCPFAYFEKEKRFVHNNRKKCVFIKYFMFALKLFTVVFKRSDRRISSDDT